MGVLGTDGAGEDRIHSSGSMPFTTKRYSSRILTKDNQVFTPLALLRKLDGGPFEMLYPFMSNQLMRSCKVKVSGRSFNKELV